MSLIYIYKEFSWIKFYYSSLYLSGIIEMKKRYYIKLYINTMNISSII
jgi:hypothetical protein